MSFRSLISPNWWVFLMLCKNVHNFNKYLTALHSSKADGKWLLTNKDGTSWSWSTLQYVYHQDLEWVSANGGMQQIALPKASVDDLDKLTCMQVHLAKHVFKFKTVSFGCN